MTTLRTGLAAASVALLVGATTAATQSSAAAADTYRAPHGIEYLNTQVNLPSGVWTDTPLQVELPRAGTYDLEADVRGRLSGTPSLNTFITARLWDASTGTAVPRSERLVYQIINLTPGQAQAGGNQTAPISELVRVNRPTTIRLQALRTDAVGTADIAQIYSDGYGYTSLRYEPVV